MNRRYRLENGDLLEETAWAVSSHLGIDAQGCFALTDGSWIEPRTFVLRSADGMVTRHYGQSSREYGLDDYLYILDVHYVRDGTLWKAMIEMGGAGHFRFDWRWKPANSTASRCCHRRNERRTDSP